MDVEKAVEKFRAGLNKDKSKLLTSPVNENAISAAIDLAYGDTKRTLKGIGKHQDKKKEILAELAGKFIEYFDSDPPDNKDDFNEKHKTLCECWYNKLSGDLGSYGKAQKIVNMTFKYLYCCKNTKDRQNYFKFCHMPLDSYTLEWYKRNIDAKLKNDVWSKLDESSYTTISDGIRKKLEAGLKINIDGEEQTLPTCPLEAEFIIWPDIQRHLAAEEFLYSLSEEKLNPNEKEEIQKQTLAQKYNSIKEKIE